jgi:hypothetical protein
VTDEARAETMTTPAAAQIADERTTRTTFMMLSPSMMRLRDHGLNALVARR